MQRELENILPKEGTVLYYGLVVPADLQARYFDRLYSEVEWKNDEARIFGKHFITKRKVAWYGDSEFDYTYSKVTKRAKIWSDTLHELKMLAESYTGATYNSCLCNLYHQGDEGMAWHSDDEKKIERDSSIASLTFGAARKFAFKHKNDKTVVSLQLESGSLLEMKDSTQTHWWHRLPTTKLAVGPRINLTFRRIIV